MDIHTKYTDIGDDYSMMTRKYRWCPVIGVTLLFSSISQAAGPALTTAASIATVIGQGDTVIQTVHHPVEQMRSVKAKVKKLFTFHRNDGKVHTLPVPKAVTE